MSSGSDPLPDLPPPSLPPLYLPLTSAHHPRLHPGVLVLQHLLGYRVGRHIIVVKHRGELLLPPTASMAAEQVSQLAGTAVLRVLLVHRISPGAGRRDRKQLRADLHQP